MRRNSRTGAWLAAVLLALGSTQALAQTQQTAARHFEQGVRLVEKHQYAQAVREFEAAYRLSPHPTTLYNLGQAYVALSRPSRALEAFRRILEEHADSVDETQRQALLRLIGEQRSKLGKIVFSVEPADARIVVDGELIQGRARSDGVELDAGTHLVEVSAPGREPRKLSVQVASGKTQNLSVFLQDKLSAAQHGALLRIDCEIPDVSVDLDGSRIGVTPLGEPLLLDAEPHRLSLRRPGYSDQNLVVELRPGEHRGVQCDLRPLRDASLQGRLVVELDQPDAVLLLDGKPLSSSALPSGRHRLRVEHWGFEPWERLISVPAGGRKVIRVELEPTPSYAREHRRVNASRRTWAYVLGAAGIAAAGTSVALIAYNGGRTNEWRSTQNELDELWPLSPGDPELARRQRDNDDLSDSIQLVDKVTVGLATAGGLLLLGGATLYFTSDDPERYGRVALGSAGSPAGLTWSGTF